MELRIIQNKIFEVRGQRIILDFDLAEMYQVETKSLNLSVKRNIKRFPEDFMFQLTQDEWDSLRFQNETSKRGGRRYLPYAFTEQGVAMLSGLLNSDIAIEVNINIMRAFVKIRNYLMEYSSISNEIDTLWRHIKNLEEQCEENLKAVNDLNEDNQNTFDDIYIALTELASKKELKEKPHKVVGYIKPHNNQ
jgi:ORF6N domain.